MPATDITGVTMPIDAASIERLLPHRYPFLFVDRILEFEPDRRIVGVKNVSMDERHLSPQEGGLPVMPPTIVMEAVAQVGALLVLAKPENHDKVPYLVGIDRIRHRRPIRAGDTMIIEVIVQKLRDTMGRMAGSVRVGNKTMATGVVTFVLGPRLRDV